MTTFPKTPARPMFKRAEQSQGPLTREHDKLLYDTTRWQAFLYDARHDATKAAESKLHDPLRTDKTLAQAKADAVERFAESMGRELFGRMYGNPERLENPNCPGWMAKVHDALDVMPEWESLKAQVASDPDLSALATNAMLRAIEPKLAELIAETEQEEQDAQGGGGAGQGGQPGKGPGKGNAPGVTAVDILRAALRGACREAAEQAQEGRDALGGLAPGLDATPPTDQQRETERFDLLQAALKNPNLQAVLRRAGRMRRIAGRQDRRRTPDAYEEIVDIELGGEIDRLCASEVIALRHPKLRRVQRAKIADRRAMQYRLEGHEPLGRGPMIFLRDVSGSMGGDPHLWGAAIAVALSGQTNRERRSMWSACFNGGICNMRKLTPEGLFEVNSQGATGKRLAHGPAAPGVAALRHVADGCGGGTNLAPAIAWAFKAGVEEPRADFVILTDDAFTIDEATAERLRKARAAGLRIWGLAVNGGSFSANLTAICDEVIDIDSLPSEDDIARKIGGMIRASR